MAERCNAGQVVQGALVPERRGQSGRQRRVVDAAVLVRLEKHTRRVDAVTAREKCDKLDGAAPVAGVQPTEPRTCAGSGEQVVTPGSHWPARVAAVTVLH
jgi:hypothetical protein